MNINTSIEQLIGNTPLLELAGYEKAHDLGARIVGKIEACNPAGSAKDRIAQNMLARAESDGLLAADTVIIEPTSGNTGIGLAALCATRGIRLIIVMPDSMSVERIKLMSAYGAELVLTPGAQGMAGAIKKADELAAAIPHAIIAGQFTNPANPDAHYATTGPEIWRDTEGSVDIFVSAAGTGGTLSGTGRFLKEQNPAIQVIAVEPAGSPVLSQGYAGPHKIQGIGAGYIPDTLDTSVYDEVIAVTDDEAFEAAREIATKDGLLVGISSGAAVAAAAKIAARPENAGKLIVVILPDTGERYLSSELFA